MPAPESWSPSKEAGRPKSPLHAGFVTGYGSPTASFEATAGIAAAGADAAAARRSGVFTDPQVQ